MNSHKQETGSAHVIVIVILVIALLGTLGFVFWQNYLKPKTDTAKSTTTSTTTPKPATTTPAPTPVPTTQTVLSLPSYGVEIPYSGTDDTYTVTAASGSNAGAYTVMSKKIADVCGSGIFGTIYQTTKGQTKPMASDPITVGNYDYSWGAYNPSCTTSSQVDTATAVQTAFGEAFKNIKASN